MERSKRAGWIENGYRDGVREREERKWEEITRPPHVYILGPGRSRAPFL
jgi:hypothetical protein